MNEPYRLRYTNQIVGAFLLVFLLFLLVLSFTVFRLSDRFGKKHLYWIIAEESQIHDLHPGAEVLILGERVGEVRRLRYEPDRRSVRVDLQINREKSDQIFQDSIIRLERKFGVGSPVLVLRRDGTGLGEPVPLEPNRQIRNFQADPDRVDQLSRQVESITESFRKIQQAAEPALESVGDAGDRIRGSLDNSVDPALDKTREASESFLTTNEQFREATRNLEARIEALVVRMDSLVDEDLRQTLADVRQSTQAFRDAADSVNQTSSEANQDLSETLERIRAASEQVRLLAEETRDVVQVVRREAKDLPGTTARVNDTVSDAQDLVGEIRSHWLLRRYSNQSSPSSQVSPSSVRGGSAR